MLRNNQILPNSVIEELQEALAVVNRVSLRQAIDKVDYLYATGYVDTREISILGDINPRRYYRELMHKGSLWPIMFKEGDTRDILECPKACLYNILTSNNKKYDLKTITAKNGEKFSLKFMLLIKILDERIHVISDEIRPMHSIYCIKHVSEANELVAKAIQLLEPQLKEEEEQFQKHLRRR